MPMIEIAPMINSMPAAIRYIFQTRRRLDNTLRGLDEYTRDTSPTRRLLARASLPKQPRDYIVITGSRGKGSVSAITAKLLSAMGLRVGTITSPHLVHWNERIRVDGRMIPSQDFLRILRALQPDIDAEIAGLGAGRYLSPQGIFLAIALRYFDEERVDVAALEVGRGGRFDDIAIVPNKLALFTPIMLEHTALLGASLARIAWHKAGIIKANGTAISLPQADAAAAQLGKEAARQHARLDILRDDELAAFVCRRADGQIMRLPAYGELFLPLLGRYQLANATLAICAAEQFGLHETALRQGLAAVQWQGRAQQLETSPRIVIDGAITPASARSFVQSLGRLATPVVAIVGVPRDRDYSQVYREMAAVSDALIITETNINPSTRFPSRADALRAARRVCDDARYADNLPAAFALARNRSGTSGTILLAGSLMLIGECMLLWDIDTRAI
ncbi:MAG: hypothetical protein F4Y70_05265 [Chloroflexi bacterium]|nr:hypothetical protein [Chloroflexota bacterium]MXX82866.1 hypothetical protein [Chloroflexota bacterium]MYD39710.1 hypothetical protein [Chloroflexota bacterium]MYE79834.1 hypothetical protein [Chloroflexota bacterium]